MTRAAKRDIDRGELREVWQKQPPISVSMQGGWSRRRPGRPLRRSGKWRVGWHNTIPTASGNRPPRARQPVQWGRPNCRSTGRRKHPGANYRPKPRRRRPGRRPSPWALAHLSEREAVFPRSDLYAAILAHAPGAVTISEAEREVAALEKAGALHAVDLPGAEDLADDRPHRRRGTRDGGVDAGRTGPGAARSCAAGRRRGISAGGRSPPGRRRR